MDNDKTRKKYLLLFGFCALPFISLFVFSLFAAIFEETSFFTHANHVLQNILVCICNLYHWTYFLIYKSSKAEQKTSKMIDRSLNK